MAQDFSLYVPPEARNPIVFYLIADELGLEALAQLNSLFKGKPAEYSPHEMPQSGQLIRFSNTPRALCLGHAVRELTKESTTLLSPYEVIDNWSKIPERNTTYADTNSVAVFLGEGRNKHHKKRVQGIIQVQRLTEPLIVSGLTVVPADSLDGFNFKETDYTTHYSFNEFVEKTEEAGIPIYLPDEKDQTGLSWLSRDGNMLSACDDGLLRAGRDGRVQFINDLRKKLKAA